MVNKDTISIVSTQENVPNLTVTREWDPKKSLCRLFVQVKGSDNREEYTENQISERALEPLFFS